jgi:hypothetical protein
MVTSNCKGTSKPKEKRKEHGWGGGCTRKSKRKAYTISEDWGGAGAGWSRGDRWRCADMTAARGLARESVPASSAAEPGSTNAVAPVESTCAKDLRLGRAACRTGRGPEAAAAAAAAEWDGLTVPGAGDGLGERPPLRLRVLGFATRARLTSACWLAFLAVASWLISSRSWVSKSVHASCHPPTAPPSANTHTHARTHNARIHTRSIREHRQPAQGTQ